MLLSALKILIFFAVVLAVTLGAVQLAETGHGLRMVYGGTEYVLGPVQALIGLILLFLLGWLVVKLVGFALAFVRFLMGDETAINRYFARSRERKGYEALSEGMLAVASGEGRLAQDKAHKAAKFLKKPHLTDLLAAQAAEVAGDSRKAGEIYRRLLSDDRTRFVGIRGLMRQKLDEGDTATALKLAEKAYALKPRHTEVQDTLLQLQTRQGDWKGARGVLKDKRKQGQLPQDVHIRRDAVLALKEASEVLAEGNSISAREAAISANRASPDLIPAAVLAARSYIAQNDFRNATRVLQKTWSVRPHPSIAATYAEIVPDETPAARLRRFEDLISKNPDNEESRLLRAELLLAAEDFPGARRALGDLAQKHPTVRSLSILAAVERGEGADDSVVRGILAKAMVSSRGPQWVCDKCHNVMSDWAPVCDSCGGFDTLTWREPDSASASAGLVRNSVELLPLLVGSPSTPRENGKDAVDAPAKPMESAPRDSSAAPVPPEPVVKTEVADVAPGMVPRESDYRRVTPVSSQSEPAMTVTDPEPEVPPAAIIPPASRPATGTARAVAGDLDVLPVRPDVEPPEDDPRVMGKKY
ncbi:heme biosynthesis HemY N-terminal domain-containing protein [Paracoccus sp. CPCC 101403]|uniref:Heme biosynthesis HemY N-terminal domain-containing protein n=1 Tax=Paracoccus broussonetiae TaxID=3075834 RepID=A0ABU3E7W6_9RHOB|nr:heme biosynthesis HemY N-terminal domain-containing protein [Paracoccus sp. CPCC 101403]MDT1060250.1 heme biosynthesis HemY N-terminal domain-containing protein [Paracoccus sp. CPCC 101403]